SQRPYPFPDIWDPLARIFDAWGFERCLWGTDWTRAFAVVNYEQAVEPFVKTDRLSDTDRAMLMGGACAKAYGWSPNEGEHSHVRLSGGPGGICELPLTVASPDDCVRARRLRPLTATSRKPGSPYRPSAWHGRRRTAGLRDGTHRAPLHRLAI